MENNKIKVKLPLSWYLSLHYSSIARLHWTSKVYPDLFKLIQIMDICSTSPPINHTVPIYCISNTPFTFLNVLISEIYHCLNTISHSIFRLYSQPYICFKLKTFLYLSSISPFLPYVQTTQAHLWSTFQRNYDCFQISQLLSLLSLSNYLTIVIVLKHLISNTQRLSLQPHI